MPTLDWIRDIVTMQDGEWRTLEWALNQEVAIFADINPLPLNHAKVPERKKTTTQRMKG